MNKKEFVNEFIKLSHATDLCDINRDTWVEFLARIKNDENPAAQEVYTQLKQFGDEVKYNSKTLKQILDLDTDDATPKKHKIILTIEEKSNYFSMQVETQKSLRKFFKDEKTFDKYSQKVAHYAVETFSDMIK